MNEQDYVINESSEKTIVTQYGRTIFESVDGNPDVIGEFIRKHAKFLKKTPNVFLKVEDTVTPLPHFSFDVTNKKENKELVENYLDVMKTGLL